MMGETAVLACEVQIVEDVHFYMCQQRITVCHSNTLTDVDHVSTSPLQLNSENLHVHC
jgi:hypothetical protein